ncbi:MAG TPA: hypothetical protein GX011_02580 [Clostridiales bacterium]|nr:hypothetical protein [Clostridiales bacterium]
MTIGLPRAMLYYRYGVLWEAFFRELGYDTLTSRETDREIFECGIKYSIDECCLPSKIFMGHVSSLIGKCDYILIPRVASYGKSQDVCVKFNALYDIARNTFEDIRILDYNIDVPKGCREKSGFVGMGKTLGFSRPRSLLAYRRAKAELKESERQKINTQHRALSSAGGPKILIVSHAYNIYDKLIGRPVSNHVRALGGVPVYAEAADKTECARASGAISQTLYWLYNRELVGSIKLLEDKIDGIILLTAFPCGPDSLVNELIIRKVRNIPTINIVIDELQGEAGLITRIESFMDIIKERAGKSG